MNRLSLDFVALLEGRRLNESSSVCIILKRFGARAESGEDAQGVQASRRENSRIQETVEIPLGRILMSL